MMSMTIDLSTLSAPQLEELAVQVQDEIKRRKAQAKKSLIADMEKLAREAGVSLSELFDVVTAKKPAKAKSAVAAKYRNPNDGSQTWSGRGRQPLWLAALIAEGKKLEDLAI